MSGRANRPVFLYEFIGVHGGAVAWAIARGLSRARDRATARLAHYRQDKSARGLYQAADYPYVGKATLLSSSHLPKGE